MTISPGKKEDCTVEEYLASLKASPKFGPQVVAHRIIEKTPSSSWRQGSNFSEELQEALRHRGVEQLYSHQGEAFEHLAAGRNVIVATPTSSGKSLIYSLPVLDKLIRREQAHALYIFPLKALSQDQLRNLHLLADGVATLKKRYPRGIAAIYDGDTTPYARRKIRQETPPVLITNPEMLHLSLLPYHENWAHFFKYLDYVVIDEVHTYRGVFGSHVAWLLRRLKRLLKQYGKRCQYILCSATIGNPRSFGESLVAEPLEVITSSGAPQSRRNLLLLNPWDSPAYTASQLLEAALKRKLRTIVYTQARKMTELISLWTKPRLGELADRLSSYRAGFLAEERRQIEGRLSEGSLLGVISTSALELGIDIGDLDICLLVGYPGSIMASRQRSGRVGRAGRDSLVVLIGSEDALDQYYMNNPERFFAGEVESATVNPRNTKIIAAHLVCAAAESPLEAREPLLAEPATAEVAQMLLGEGQLLLSGDGSRYYAARKRPQRLVNLRGSGRGLTIIDADTGVIMGEVDAARALKECHEGAVYLHRMQTFLIEKLDLPGHEVVARAARPTFYTRPMSNKNTEIIREYEKRSLFGCTLSFGALKVSEQVTGYQKRNTGTNRLVSTIALDLPVQTMETEGIWIDIPATVVAALETEKLHFMGGLHALEHLLISVFPLLILCDRNDVGGISCPHHEQTDGATIFIYDGHAGGSGVCAEAYEVAERLFDRAREIVQGCSCDNGCPACVHSPKCGSGNRPIDKRSCIELLVRILAGTRAGAAEPRETRRPAGTALVSLAPPPTEHPLGLEALPARWGVFDLETKFSAEEVGGWHRAEKMGISVAVVYDSEIDGYATYFEEEVGQLLAHLDSFAVVVGFNNRRFDNRVLSGYTTEDVGRLPSLDLLEEVQRFLGYRLSLGGLAEQTLGEKKSGDGLQALRWYRQNNFAMLSKYCRKDVELTKNLLLHGLERGYLLFRNKAGKTVRLPVQLDRAINSLLRRGSPGAQGHTSGA